MRVQTKYFLIFQNILSLNFQGLFLYPTKGTLNKKFFTWSSLTCDIFSENSWFLCSDKSQVQKSDDVIACLFCTIKKKQKKQTSRNSESA